MDAFAGSIEILTADNTSIGLPGLRWTADVVPTIAEAVYGITQMAGTTPTERPTGRTPEAQWTGRDVNNQDIVILLWKDETA